MLQCISYTEFRIGGGEKKEILYNIISTKKATILKEQWQQSITKGRNRKYEKPNYVCLETKYAEINVMVI